MTLSGRQARPRFELRAVPKPGGGVRWLADLDPATDRRYRLAVAPVVARIERALDPGVVGNRAGPGGRLRPPGPARRRWRRALGHAATGHRTVIMSDVVACYASIDVDAVGEALALLGVPNARIRGIHRVLSDLRSAGLHGLPVGPDASGILANAVLAAADLAVRRAGGDVVRWVDDVAIVGIDRRAAVGAFDAWAGALRAVRLEPHDGKTRLLLPSEIRGTHPPRHEASSGIGAVR